MIHFEKILVAFSSEEKDWTALQLSLRLAQDSGGSLTVAHVIPPLPQDIPYDLTGLDDLRQTLEHAADASLQAALERLPDHDVPVDTRILWGHTAMELSRIVMKERHDLVMKATGGGNRISGQLLGSVDMRLLRKCPSPVWLVKPGGHQDVTSVLVTVDTTSTEEDHRALNTAILEMGVGLAKMEGAELNVLHAWKAWGDHLLRHRIRSKDFSGYVRQIRSRTAKAFTELLRPFDEEIPRLNRHLIEGQPEEVVPEFALSRDVDVVVMGTVARTGVPGFLIGNTAEMILSEVECSVLAVKPEGFVTPVEPEAESEEED